MKVSDILKVKGSNVYWVTPQTSVFEALKQMSEKNIGALLVMEDGKLKGIFSERDYARKIILMGRSSQETLVQEIMTERVFTVSPDERIEQCMELMSENRFRHLPVVNDSVVVGVISISDVVTAIIHKQKETIDHLKDYISK
ncbi:MAG: CBS domain-containing protein [Bacteroidota bacterium]|nr:CBS domain-containing protein [Flavisolibacter sp.]MBD0296552.1 CBS domain-containing protein [Flavisolibacter sp.]MBD0350391.1 CBS domain-containing protein [Flavisolibacter sp.]MBD0368105.1 CBS domain-containing protein [Flavisolibacter sp.]MDQ3845929.1 CBS domain-containing protein [Bacteroidota bacterium]